MPSVDIIREEFGRLIKQAKDVYEQNRDNTQIFDGDALAEFTQIRTSATNLVHLLYIENIALRDEHHGAIKTLVASLEGVATLQGILKAHQQSYKIGLLNLRTVIETSVISDYMNLAEQLLGEGVEGQYDHIPAAVLAGAVLEDALRRLCERQNPPVAIKVNGKYKMLKALIDDLKQSSVFNASTAKELEAWTSIRNHAAHGEFDEVNRSSVERMIKGIENFLADYL